MKVKISVLAFLMFGCIMATNAQQRRTVEERVKMTVSRMSDSLTLDKSQMDKTEPVLTDYYTSMDKMREGLAPGTRPEKADMDKLIAGRDAQLSKILTPAQFQKFKDMEERMRQERMKRMNNN